MNINGMTNKVDVINSIIDNIDDKELDTAKDSLNQLREKLHPCSNCVVV